MVFGIMIGEAVFTLSGEQNSRLLRKAFTDESERGMPARRRKASGIHFCCQGSYFIKAASSEEQRWSPLFELKSKRAVLEKALDLHASQLFYV